MKFWVNENCVGCGTCNSICSEVFSLTQYGIAQAGKEDVVGEQLVKAREALQSCPVLAISQTEY